MSVLKGEGRVPILFTTTSVAVGPITRRSYLTRPDLAGEWPTIVVVPSAWGLTSSTKDICRRLARQGFAVVGVDLYHGDPPPRDAGRAEADAADTALDDARVLGHLGDIATFVANPAGFWSSAERGFGWLGLGSGGRHAAVAATSGLGDALAVAYTPVAAQARGIAPIVPSLTMPLLGLYGRDDADVPGADLVSLREGAAHGEFVIYEGVGGDFLDDHGAGYDYEAAGDAIERLTAFFEKHLPEPPG